ncbi:uncharacterized protein LOC114348597 isoform X3 [Diabrotica virgifera virgifera]|uniref:Uncharacterized protein n=1 Tax=Diabrotica virgifera virgifera TaxID=50390 RepID=A0ABM5K2E5_DIAVI|nr:uncharacterized protein LOC114348597 isoform X3 [Diabrotica virgifera virgifera]
MTKLLMVFIAVFVAVLADTTEDKKRFDTIQKGADYLKTCEQNLGGIWTYVYTKGYKKIKEEHKDLIGDVLLCAYTKLGIMTENGDLIDDKVSSFYGNLLGENNNYILKNNNDIDVYTKRGLIETILKICKPSKDLTPKRKVFSYQYCVHTEIFTKYSGQFPE